MEFEKNFNNDNFQGAGFATKEICLLQYQIELTSNDIDHLGIINVRKLLSVPI